MKKFISVLKRYQMIIFSVLAVIICAGASLLGYFYLTRMEKALWNQLVLDLTEVTYQGGHAFETYAVQERGIVEKIADGMKRLDSDNPEVLEVLDTYALGDGLHSLIT